MATFFRLAVVGALLVSAQFAEARKQDPRQDPMMSHQGVKAACRYLTQSAEATPSIGNGVTPKANEGKATDLPTSRRPARRG